MFKAYQRRALAHQQTWEVVLANAAPKDKDTEKRIPEDDWIKNEHLCG